MEIVALHIGRPRTLTSAAGRAFTSAIVKESVPSGVRLALVGNNLDGDRQANRRVHGGPDKALCVYPEAHYPHWRATLLPDLPYGAFGENLTVAGADEDSVCVGDTFAHGEVRLRVSQPRQPCVNLVRRWGVADLPERMIDSSRTGFYLRIVHPGDLAAGDALTLADRPNRDWTLRRANAAMYGQGDPDAVRAERLALRALTELSAEWKRMLARRLAVS